jgi:hypothetical protein
MGLNNYQPERHEFALKGGSFSVRGLSLEDVSRLVNHHLPDIEALIDLIVGDRDLASLDQLQLQPLVVSLVGQAPGFVANLIALAADEPDGAKSAARLPAPVQIDVVMKIGEMTFSDVGGVGKGMERIAPLLQKISKERMGSLTKTLTKAG